MRVTRAQADLNRERIVEAAARLFRVNGFAGIGVADLMKAVGLTHGGFYGKFRSKEQLIAEACELALRATGERWARNLERASTRPLSSIASFYLSRKHRDEPGTGCVMAALGADAARQGPEVRATLSTGVERFIGLLAKALPGGSARARRRRAIASVSALVGGLVLARAVGDEALSDEILEAVAGELAQREAEEA